MSKLLVRPFLDAEAYQRITPATANWRYLSMEARLMKQGQSWTGYTGNAEYGFILLSGNYTAVTSRGTWKTLNGRKNVFAGIAHSLYLPRHTEFTITADSEYLDIAAGWVTVNEDYPARFKTPEEAAIEIRGGENATRQINSLIEPGFGCSRIVSVEVYTPAGNWSSFPAHKHDVRTHAGDGSLTEAELEEIYFYKISRPEGFAIQQVYTADKTLDELVRAGNNDAVLVPKGYHPVVALHGYDCYYLNFLAGTDQSLANTPDPDHAWLFNTWKFTDPRIPMVTAAMNQSE